MGCPRLDASQIPVTKESGRVVSEPVTVDGRTFQVTAVSMGNPHAVIYADQLTDELVQVYGPRLEQHPFFPQHANVEFVKVLSEQAIQMRVYERGCGETAACGTGACAAVVAGVLNQKHGHAVMVRLPDGELSIEWDGALDHPVYMTGPARWVFAGAIEL
jgi:diaminopimelate epimerase